MNSNIETNLAENGSEVAEEEGRASISVTIELDIHDPAAFRHAAYKRALDDNLGEDEAKEYLDAEKTSLGACAIMILDPGVSPDGASIENSSSDEH
ncbi:hypothetical protein A8H39_00120 [Paraburkholderia fungorum]|uniref:hypothetical protein n=1 Tax=Paraburkholderia fungorum TaxID=134537 RepID=UPI000481251A|nr:hypothetical protein [Paraburkholderia fungorum]MBB5546527.1 hypothetical protein [Paraburkholderia fungorum]PNE59591.1 hypothetical protein A8H39_00120 [Paraburkholderia fungorum]